MILLVIIVCLVLIPTFIQKDFCCDFVGQTVPWNHFLLLSIKEKNLPLWSPFAYLGVPFLFTPTLAVFHPLTMLVLLLNILFNFHQPSIETTGKIIQYVFIVAYCIGGTGMYLLSRKILTVSKYAALFAGLVYALNPFWISTTHVTWMAWGFASLPWIFLSLTLFFSKPSFTLFLFIVICNVLNFATGYPYYYVFCIFAQLLLAFLYGPKKLFLFIVSLLNSVALSGIFLFPYIHIFLQSGRSENVYDFNWHSFAALFPTSILLIFNPLYYSTNISKYPNISDIFQGVAPTWGTFAFIFLIYGLLSLKKKPIYRWAVLLFFISLLYSFGANLSTYSFFGTILPVVYKFRSHFQALSLTIFTGVIFISIGFDAIYNKFRLKYVDIAFWYICISTFISLLLGPVFFLNKIISTSEVYRGTSIMFFFLFTSLTLCALFFKFGKKSFLALCILIMLIEYHYYIVNFKGFYSDNVTYDQFYAMHATIPEIPSTNNLFRINFQTRYGNNSSIIKVYGLQGYENIVPPAYGNLITQYGGYSKLLQVTNVKYVISTQDNLDTDLNLVKLKIIYPADYPKEFIPSDSNTLYYIYLVKGYLPRFYAPKKVEECSEIKCWKKESIPDLILASGIKKTMVNPNDVKINIDKYTDNSIEITTITPQTTFIASSETYDDGWNLLVNNKPSKIYVTSNGLRGFIVPAGRSKISMNYIPPFFIFGSIFSFFGIILLFILFKFRKKFIFIK